MSCLVAAVVLIAFYYVVLDRFRGRAWLARAMGEFESPENVPETVPFSFLGLLGRERYTMLFGVVLCGLVFFSLERQDPYFFTQDDSAIQQLPVCLLVGRSLCSGAFPVWNPCQGGGEPILDNANNVAMSPISALAYVISKFLLHNEFALIEVYCFLHLVIGFLGGYWAGRQWGLSRPSALAVGLCYTLSCVILIQGRVWANQMVAAWLPLLLGLLAPRQLRCISGRWVLTFVAVTGLSFHAAHVQVWFFSFLFYGLLLAALLIARLAPLRAIAWHVTAALLGIATVLPVLFVQMDFTKDVERSFPEGQGNLNMVGVPYAGVLAAIVPPPLIEAGHPFWPETPDLFGQYYYVNTVYALAALLLGAALLGMPWSRRIVGNNLFFFFLVLALLLSLGENSPVPINQWLAKLPWVCKFREPYRYYVFVNLFALFAGALVLERVLAGLRREKFWRCVVAGAAIVFALYAAVLPKPVLCHAPAKPYPPLPQGFDDIVKGSAMTSEFPQRSTGPFPQNEGTQWSTYNPGGYDGLTANIASAWGLLSMSRYSTITWYHRFSYPLFQKYNAHLVEAFRAYGVKWHIRNAPAEYDPKTVEALGTPRKLDKLQVWEVNDPCPMAFCPEQPSHAFPIHFSVQGARVDFQEEDFRKGGRLRINILAWPRFKVYADGKLVPHMPDEWGRIALQVPPGTLRIEAIYSPPLRAGILLATASALLGFLVWVVLAAWERRRGSGMNDQTCLGVTLEKR